MHAEKRTHELARNDLTVHISCAKFRESHVLSDFDHSKSRRFKMKTVISARTIFHQDFNTISKTRGMSSTISRKLRAKTSANRERS